MAYEYRNIHDLIRDYETLFKQYSELVTQYEYVLMNRKAKDFNDPKNDELKLIKENLSNLEEKLNHLIDTISPEDLNDLEDIIKNVRKDLSQFGPVSVEIGEFSAKDEFYYVFLVKLYFANGYL